MKKLIIILLLVLAPCFAYADSIGGGGIYGVPTALTDKTINNTIIGGTTPAAGTFTALKGNFDEIIEAATGTIVAAEMKGQIINNYGQTGDTVLTLDAAFEGAYFTVILGTTVAKYFRLDPNASDGIILDGAAIDTDGHYVGIASAAQGAAIQFMAIQTGASTYDWFATTISGAWVSE